MTFGTGWEEGGIVVGGFTGPFLVALKGCFECVACRYVRQLCLIRSAGQESKGILDAHDVELVNDLQV